MTLEPSGGGGALERSQESSLADVVNTILDKGVVVDIFARVSLVGIELLRVDARVVIASVDTYLRYAEAVNRLEMGSEEPSQLDDMIGDVSEAGSRGKTKGALEAGAEKLEDILGTADEKEEATSGREESR
jgi:gas vesicle structural protein